MLYFTIAFLLSVIFTLLIRRLALRFGVLDRADEARKIGKGPVPLLGGTAIFLSFFLVAGYLLYIHPLYDINIFAGKMLGVFIASVLLLNIGALDDKFGLSPKARLFFSALSALIVVAGGVGLAKITNPFGGIIEMNSWALSAVLIFFWLLGMMYTVKISDGLDGLATGVVFIGALVIYFFTNTAKYFQPNVGLLALVFAGACLGFLLFNFYPAKIYLGEGGGLFLGLMLGVLAVISGGKLAMALLVMAIPILDLARVLYVRRQRGQSLFQGDREHLHFRLLDSGLKEWQAVLLFYFVAAFTGAAALFLQSRGKLIALLLLTVFMLILTGVWLRKGK